MKISKLSVEASLDKKLGGCVSDHLSYELKPGKKLVTVFSFVAFEKRKKVHLKIFNQQTLLINTKTVLSWNTACVSINGKKMVSSVANKKL